MRPSIGRELQFAANLLQFCRLPLMQIDVRPIDEKALALPARFVS
jgi:hypothetical protein